MNDIEAKIQNEQTFMMVKPDGVSRGLTGEIIKRVEQRGLKVVACKMVKPTEKLIDDHYPKDKAWITRLGEKTMKTFKEYDIDPKEAAGTDDLFEIGSSLRKYLVEFMISGPVVATVVQGPHARDMVRKIAGETLPIFAPPGTIRGDYSADSPAIANLKQRPIKNLVHASETEEEATNEIGLWFTKDEIHEYKRADEDVAYEK